MGLDFLYILDFYIDLRKMKLNDSLKFYDFELYLKVFYLKNLHDQAKVEGFFIGMKLDRNHDYKYKIRIFLFAKIKKVIVTKDDLRVKPPKYKKPFTDGKGLFVNLSIKHLLLLYL